MYNPIAGKNVNDNNFPPSNAKKYRPSFEGDNGPYQDERYSPSTHTEESEQSCPNWKQQLQQQPLPHRKPKREKSPPETDNRLVCILFNETLW